MKAIRYKKVNVNKPDNISMNLVKKIVDELGGDYSITVDSIVNFISKNKGSINSQENN